MYYYYYYKGKPKVSNVPEEVT